MDRRLVALLATALIAAAALAHDHSPEDPKTQPSPTPQSESETPSGLEDWRRDKGPDRLRKPEERDGRKILSREDKEWIRQRLQKLSPEERAKFLENLRKWQELPPEARQRLRKRVHEEKREMFQKALQEAIVKTGLELTPEQREAFAKRYGEERRKLELQLRAEMDRRRQELLPEMLERLKSEFNSPSRPSPTPSTPPTSTGETGS